MSLLPGIAAGITVLASLLMLLCWRLNFKNFNFTASGEAAVNYHRELQPLPAPQLTEYPAVAILLAVRDEEANLPPCLHHLLAQDYPAEKIHIWIGNDGSTDRTLAIARDYARQYSHIQVADIREQAGEARAKANVIAQLVQASRSSTPAAALLLVTDADTRPPRFWVRGMLQSLQTAPDARQTGIVTGTTLVAGEGVWALLQRIDWLFALGMVKLVSDMGFPTATLGNNKLMRREAYEATGGYEALPFSITEDFQILQEITRRGFGFRNVVHTYGINFTLPMQNIWELLEQRKRWMHGAIRLPWPVVGILFLQALFYPCLLLLGFLHPMAAVLLFAGKVTAQAWFITLIISKLKFKKVYRRKMVRLLLLYDPYAALLTLATIIYYYLPLKTRWKGRSF